MIRPLTNQDLNMLHGLPIDINVDQDEISNYYSLLAEMVVLKVLLPLIAVLGTFKQVRYKYTFVGFYIVLQIILCKIQITLDKKFFLNSDNIDTKNKLSM